MVSQYSQTISNQSYVVCVFVCAHTHRADGVMRTMAPDKLLKAMPALQTQVDTLLEFDVSNISHNFWDLLSETEGGHLRLSSPGLGLMIMVSPPILFFTGLLT